MTEALTPELEAETEATQVAFSPKAELDPKTQFVAPGAPAKYPYAVLYQAEYETEWDGTAVAARLHARALAAAGLPVLLRSFSLKFTDSEGAVQEAIQGIPEAVEKEVGILRKTSAAQMMPMIKHIVIRDHAHLQNLVWPRGASAGFTVEQQVELRDRIYGHTILFSVWERDSVDEKIARELQRIGECWVPCEQNAEMLRRHGVERVRVMPHPFDPADPLCKLVGRNVRTDDWKLFYSIGRWEPRKGYDKLIEAFLLAFKPGDHAKLTLKITGGDWPNFLSPKELILQLLGSELIQKQGWTLENFVQHVSVFSARKPRSEIIALHYYNNIYVSPSHGEAWNLPAFEAKLAGNAMVHVPYGGTCEFADIKLDVTVPIQMGPVHASYGWEPAAQWADYDVLDLARALQKATPPREYAVHPGIERFSLKQVGVAMRDAVLGLCDRVHPKCAAFYRGAAVSEGEKSNGPTEAS
jgi:glycosyltransferase involved in cell wall biosynthesis